MTPAEFVAYRAWQAQPLTAASMARIFGTVEEAFVAAYSASYLSQPLTYRESLMQREAAKLRVRQSEVAAFRHSSAAAA